MLCAKFAHVIHKIGCKVNKNFAYMQEKMRFASVWAKKRDPKVSNFYYASLKVQPC